MVSLSFLFLESGHPLIHQRDNGNENTPVAVLKHTLFRDVKKVFYIASEFYCSSLKLQVHAYLFFHNMGYAYYKITCLRCHCILHLLILPFLDTNNKVTVNFTAFSTL